MKHSVSFDKVHCLAKICIEDHVFNIYMYFQKVKCQDMPNVLEHYETCFVFLK